MWAKRQFAVILEYFMFGFKKENLTDIFFMIYFEINKCCYLHT